MTENDGPGARRRVGVIVVQVVVGCLALAMVGGVVALVWLFVNAGPEAPQAQVGNCMAGAADGKYQLIDCADGSAAFTVVGRVEGKEQAEAPQVCKALKEAAPEQAYWEGAAGRPGVVLCLKRVAPPSPSAAPQ